MSPTITRRGIITGFTSLTTAAALTISNRFAQGSSHDLHEMASPIASPSASPAVTDPDAPRVVVHIDKFAFVPREIEIKSGTRVVWSNDDGAAHTATADDKSFDSGHLTFSEKFGHTFSEAGTYTYYCAFHANMTGKVTVMN